jgi:hypothetical protein
MLQKGRRYLKILGVKIVDEIPYWAQKVLDTTAEYVVPTTAWRPRARARVCVRACVRACVCVHPSLRRRFHDTPDR